MATDGETSGRFDDRWAFTTNTSALNYGSAAALTAASRALRGYNDELAEESLATARRVWEYEQNREPNLFRYGNTTGGPLVMEQLKRSEEHTSELQSRGHLVCRLLLEKKKQTRNTRQA